MWFKQTEEQVICDLNTMKSKLYKIKTQRRAWFIRYKLLNTIESSVLSRNFSKHVNEHLITKHFLWTSGDLIIFILNHFSRAFKFVECEKKTYTWTCFYINFIFQQVVQPTHIIHEMCATCDNKCTQVHNCRKHHSMNPKQKCHCVVWLST